MCFRIMSVQGLQICVSMLDCYNGYTDIPRRPGHGNIVSAWHMDEKINLLSWDVLQKESLLQIARVTIPDLASITTSNSRWCLGEHFYAMKSVDAQVANYDLHKLVQTLAESAHIPFDRVTIPINTKWVGSLD